MLRWIIGGAVVLAVSAIANDREEKAKEHYKNKLNKQETVQNSVSSNFW